MFNVSHSFLVETIHCVRTKEGAVIAVDYEDSSRGQQLS